MRPLAINVQVAGTPEGVRANIQSALARHLPELHPALVPHDGHFVCVGSGPSMPGQIEQIKAERLLGRPIVAVKGAHDFLCDHGLEPDIWVCVDPRDRSTLVSKPNQRTRYLLASRCDPTMFEALKAQHVILFHAWGDAEHCPEYEGKFVIGGGTTSGLRAITVGYVLGFRSFVLYGYDSCMDRQRTMKRFTGETVEREKQLDVIVNGKRFWTNGAMAKQAEEFQSYYHTMPDIEMTVHGDGLLAEIVKARKERGFQA